ncbi:hypothetical protein BC332_21743 [Capsicum chinense]|nr:hypothetical protein BC332_21743 [Capsicum chinense]
MPYYNIDTQRDIVIATMTIHNYIRKKCNVDNAFQMAENERYIPLVDFDVGTTSMANNIDGKNSGAKVYVKPSEATPWRDDEATLFFNAADNGNAEIIKCLLQAGGDPNIIDEHGNKPIQVAAIRCYRAAVKVLLPVTQRILSFPEWSVDGVIEFMQYEYRRRQLDGLFEYMDSYYYSTRLESTEAGRKAKKPRETIIPKKDFPELNMPYVMPRPAENLDQIGQKLIIGKRFGEAANVFYEVLQIDPTSKELLTAFRESIEADRRFHGMSEKNLSSSKS